MNDAVHEIRVRAEILHRKAQTTNDTTLRNRFRGVPNFDPTHIRRRDCLLVLAKEVGFLNWPHAKRVLSGEGTDDFGTLLCPKKCGGHLNLWYKTHPEAEAVLRDRGGYLLAYRKQFLVVERSYIEALGLDPDDLDWQALGFDWTRSGGQESTRARLYSKLITALPPETNGT